MGRRRHSRAAVSTRERPRNRVTVLPVQAEARFRSPLPTAWPMLIVVPMARPTIITDSMCITWDPTATAVVLALPSN